MGNLREEIIMAADQWVGRAGIEGNTITSVVDFCKLLVMFFRRGKFLYRGEGKLFENPLLPIIYRDSSDFKNTLYPNKQITDKEVFEIEKCQSEYANGIIKDRYIRAFIPLIQNNDVNWIPLARHHGFKTRLLDITLNPLVALYFACVDLDDSEDAYVYAFQPGNLRPVNNQNKKQQGRNDFPPIPLDFTDLYDVDVQFWGKEIDKLPYLFEPLIPQERMLAQAGKFIFWRHPGSIFKPPNLIPLRVDKAKKGSIINELSVFGVTNGTLFP